MLLLLIMLHFGKLRDVMFCYKCFCDRLYYSICYFCSSCFCICCCFLLLLLLFFRFSLFVHVAVTDAHQKRDKNFDLHMIKTTSVSERSYRKYCKKIIWLTIKSLHSLTSLTSVLYIYLTVSL